MINKHNDSLNLTFIVIMGIVLLISLLLIRPIINTNLAISNIGLPAGAIDELKRLLSNH